VLQPVQLLETPAGLQPVAGFRRLQVAAELRLDEVPAQVARGEAGPLFALAVEEHAGQGCNVREQARAVAVSMELGWSAEQVARDLLPALGLQPHAGLVTRYVRLQAMPAELLDLLVSKGYSLRRCLPFCDLPEEDCRLLAVVAVGMGLGGRQIEEVSSQLREVAAREDLALAQVVEQLGLDRQDGDDAGGLGRLELRRYPEASRRRREMEALARQLAGGEVAVRFDRNFARDGVDLGFHVHSVQKLRELTRELGTDHSLELIRQILDKQ